MTYRKKLIEVALPLEAISAASAKEKNRHVGTLANLHTWWSRKPLAASRAVIFASLVDDPGEYLPEGKAEQERKRLFQIIEKLVAWESMSDTHVLKEAQDEIRKSAGGETLSFLDPFCGGASIPLEAQRLGLSVTASDLNPVAVLLAKIMIEIAPGVLDRPPINPKDKQSLADAHSWSGTSGFSTDVRYYGEWIRQRAEKTIGHLYPKVQLPKQYGGKEAPVVSWLWARQVRCPNPACQAHTPLVSKFWVSTHKGNEAWIQPAIDKEKKVVDYRIKYGPGSPPLGTVDRSGARCLVCESPITFDYIRSQGRAGLIDYRLISIVADSPGKRLYVPPNADHAKTATDTTPSWSPETDLPEKALGFRVQRYGMTKHRDLFTNRQLTALTTISDLIANVHEQIMTDSNGDSTYAKALTTFLALSLSRLAQTNNTLVRWLVRTSGTSKGTPAFDRPIISMVWEFSEGNVFFDSVGSWAAALENPLTALQVLPRNARPGRAVQLDASAAMVEGLHPVVSTDPPYFDNIGYADLSDFYYIWLRRALSKFYPDIFSTVLVPKKQELVAAPHLGGQDASESHFLEGLQRAFDIIRGRAHPEYPVTLYYAFKQTESKADEDTGMGMAISSTGWETLLEALLRAGFSVTGTWPIRTEQIGRMRAIDSNTLDSSIVLVCRPRPETAPLATRREFVNALKRDLPTALTKLMQGGIAPVDLAQAAIGPGMAVFSRYARVLEADGQAMPVRTALQLINQHLDEYLTAEDSELDKDTRFALAWFQQFGHDEGPFGDADVLARAKDTSVAGMVQAGVAHSRGGKVRLLRRDEFTKDWDPRTDARLTVWECAQQLIRRLNEKGEDGAAALAKQMGGGRSEDARALAYRLYAICERKKWADEALAYNALVVSWPEIEKKAASLEGEAEQSKLL